MIPCDVATLLENLFCLVLRDPLRGPFLESSENVSGPKSHL